MTVRQLPQPGDVVATRVQDQGDAVDLHGAVLVARRDEPQQSEATDLSNVVPFARPRRQGAAAAFPLPSIAPDERSAPPPAGFGIGRGIALLAASLVLHSALLAMFWHQPQPVASVGIEVMTVEITLGANTAAGLAQQPGENEVQSIAAPNDRAQEEPVTELARAATVMPQEMPVATQDQAPETKPLEMLPQVESVEPTPQEPQAAPETAAAETVTQPTEKPPERTVPPRPQIQTVQKAPERKRVAAPTDKKAAQKKQEAAARRTSAASGIDRGRSDKSVNYAGIVRAHLVRYKRDPSGAGGRKGTAAVQILLDAGGRVTSARLVKSSGVAAFDQEIVAMARRASPFPPPPNGRGGDFSISVSFDVR